MASRARGGRMAVYIEGHAESLVAAADEGVAAEERLRRGTEKLNAEQARGTKGFASYTTQTSRSAKETDKHAKSTERLGSGLKSAATGTAAFIGAYAGVSALENAAHYTEELVHATQILTKVSGLDTQQASQWIEMAKQRGIDTTKLGMAFTTLSKQIRGAETGSKTAEKNFHALGIPLAELRDLSTEQVLERISDKFAETSDGAKKAALNQSFFGKSARDLLPILDKGSAGLKQQLGMFSGLSEAQQKQGEEALAYQRKVGVAIDQLKIKVAFGMLGIAKVISNPDLTLDQKINYVMKKADTELEKGVSFLATHMAEHAPEVAESFAKGFLNAPILGQAVFGGLLLAKFGGFGLLGGVFTKQGKLSAESFAGGLKTAIPGAIAAAGLDNILSSALHGDTEGAMYKSGGAVAGALVGGIVGGLPGALAGAGIGSFAGGEIGKLLGGEAVKRSVPIYRQARTALDGYRKSSEELSRAKQHEQRASQESRAAEEKLQRVRSEHGANSKPAIRAEVEYKSALNKTGDAIKRNRNLERAHGAERHALAAVLRVDVRKMAQETANANNVRKAEAEGLKGITSLYRKGLAPLSEVRSRLRSYQQASEDASKKNQHLKQTIADAAKEIGGPYAASLEHIADRSTKTFNRTNSLAQALQSADRSRASTSKKARAEEATAEERTASRSTKSIKEIQGSYRGLDQVSSTALEDLGERTNTFLSAIGAKTVPFGLGKAMGGPVTVPGVGLQDTVPIMHSEVAAVVAPGEKLYVTNRHQEPLLDQAVSNEYGVNGLQGFYEAFNRPHYMAIGGLYEPKLRDGISGLRRGGQRGIHRAYRGAVKYIEAHDGIARVIANGNRMDALHQPYLWGGGHGATASRNGPWDCSGGISELLNGAGFNFAPMVSGGFENWGAPGKGEVSILANADHVYAVIKGHGAIGTSDSNPGGGFGWIDGYTFRPGFTIRHADFSQAARPMGGGKRGKGQKQKKGFASGGLVVSGKASYEGGTGHMTADGKHTDEDPGFAIRDDSTLGDWFWTTVGGHSGLLQHTDWGPATSTGRAIDFTAAGLHKIGAPLSITDTQAKVEWMGHTVAEAAKRIPGKSSKAGAKFKPHAAVGNAKAVLLPPLKPEHLTGPALGLPAPIQAMLKAPGLSFARKLEIGQYASQIAGTTKGTEDDVAAAKFNLSLEERNKKRIQRELAKIARELKQPMTPARRKKLLAHREQLLSGLATASSEISAARETINAPGEEGESESKAQEEALKAQEALTAQLEQMNELLKQQNENTERALNVSQSQYGVLAKAISDVVSGQIGGRVGLGFQTPSVAGSTANY